MTKLISIRFILNHSLNIYYQLLFNYVKHIKNTFLLLLSLLFCIFNSIFITRVKVIKQQVVLDFKVYFLFYVYTNASREQYFQSHTKKTKFVE